MQFVGEVLEEEETTQETILICSTESTAAWQGDDI